MNSGRLRSFDLYVSYASQDKDFARSLVSELAAQGISVWFDEGEIRVGDDILRHIEEGLEHSRYFVLIVSPAFFERSWTQFELGVALARPEVGKARVLPIYLGVDADTVRQHMPLLADKLAVDGSKYSANEIARIIAEQVKQ